MKATRLCSIMLGLLLTTAVQASVEINKGNFPDEAFRTMITSLPEGKDGMLTDEEISSITYLSVKGDVANVKGIEYLTALTMLDCNYCKVTDMDLSANTALEIIRMELVPLETLNVSGLSSLRYLLCSKTSLSKLDVSTCTALQYLVMCEGHLTELDLSNNINLKELDCSSNQLSSLILPQSETLTEVKCYANQLSGENMDQLVASLPIVAKGNFYVYVEVAEADENEPQYEFNVCTTSQVEVAKSKNWTVYGRYHIGSEYWEEYAGSDPTSIRPAIRGSAASDCYSLDGRQVNSLPTRKGIYIQNGKKVIVK